MAKRGGGPERGMVGTRKEAWAYGQKGKKATRARVHGSPGKRRNRMSHARSARDLGSAAQNDRKPVANRALLRHLRHGYRDSFF